MPSLAEQGYSGPRPLLLWPSGAPGLRDGSVPLGSPTGPGWGGPQFRDLLGLQQGLQGRQRRVAGRGPGLTSGCEEPLLQTQPLHPQTPQRSLRVPTASQQGSTPRAPATVPTRTRGAGTGTLEHAPGATGPPSVRTVARSVSVARRCQQASALEGQCHMRGLSAGACPPTAVRGPSSWPEQVESPLSPQGGGWSCLPRSAPLEHCWLMQGHTRQGVSCRAGPSLGVCPGGQLYAALPTCWLRPGNSP